MFGIADLRNSEPKSLLLVRQCMHTTIHLG